LLLKRDMVPIGMKFLILHGIFRDRAAAFFL